MSLPRVKLLLMTDETGGISKNGKVPFDNEAVKKFQREKTIGQGKNCIIMGRNTFEMIGMQALDKRSNVVISKTLKQHQHPDVKIQASIFDALAGAGQMNYSEVYVIGGEQVFYQFLTQWLHLVDSIIITRFKRTYGCDVSFPMALVKDMKKQDESTLNWVRTTYFPGVVHPENAYLSILRETLSSESKLIDESRPLVKINIGGNLTFNQIPGSLRTIPIFTTRALKVEDIVEGALASVSKFEDVILSIRKEPHLQVHICQLDHAIVQFFVSSDRKRLGMCVYQFRIDLTEELPLSVGMMSLILNFVATVTGLLPDFFKVSWGEGYIRESPGLLTLLARTPLPFARISFRRMELISEIRDFDADKIQIDHYISWPYINLSGR